jgi:hypothetical protein
MDKIWMKRVEKALLLILTLHLVSMILHTYKFEDFEILSNNLFFFFFFFCGILYFGFRDFNERCQFVVMVGVTS